MRSTSRPSSGFLKLAEALSTNKDVSVPRVTDDPGASLADPMNSTIVGDPDSYPVDNRQENQTLTQASEARAEESKADYLRRYFALGRQPTRDVPHTDLSYMIRRDLQDASLQAYREQQAKPSGQQIDKLASSNDLIPGGKASGMPASDFSSKQMAMGAKVEKEHTPSTAKAKEIAKDHLEEFPDYYSRLKKMEDEAKQEKTASPDAVDQRFRRIYQDLGATFLK